MAIAPLQQLRSRGHGPPNPDKLPPRPLRARRLKLTQPPRQAVTEILDAITSGDRDAVGELLSVVYEELRVIARSRLAGLSAGQSLRPTDLVHEAYIKMVNVKDRSWESRRHFINAAGTAMRSIIVDRARAKARVKRGGDMSRQEMHADLAFTNRDPAEIVAIDECLTTFARTDERAAQVVSMRVFLGMPEAEIALILGVSERTVHRDWTYAKAWMRSKIQGNGLITGESDG